MATKKKNNTPTIVIMVPYSDLLMTILNNQIEKTK